MSYLDLKFPMTNRTNLNLFRGGHSLRIGHKNLARWCAMTNPETHLTSMTNSLPLPIASQQLKPP
jgi:hypothetical protein